MLKYKDQPLPSLSHDDGPLPGLGYSPAGILSADVEQNRTHIGLEVFTDDKVPLLPVGGDLIIEMIQDLIKPVLLLIIDKLLLSIFQGLLQVFYLFACVYGKDQANQKKCYLHRLVMIKQINDAGDGLYKLQFYLGGMEEGMLDISKIPKFEFQLKNQQLINCIKELHFQSKTQEKHLQKVKKQLENRPTDTQIADSYVIINSNIDIDPALLKHIANRNDKKVEESPLAAAANKLGNKIGQISDVLQVLFEKTKQLEKRMEISQNSAKLQLSQKVTNLQGQLDEFKKIQTKETRTLSDTIQISINKYEQKLREVESKTLWQINDCKTKLSDRVNQQFVRDVVKESEAKFTTKLKQSLIKNNIDPERIDRLESRCLKLEKDIDIKIVEVNAKISELKEYIEHNLTTKKEIGNQKLENQKKIGNLQVISAQLGRRCKNMEMELATVKEDLSTQGAKHEQSGKELGRVAKMVANLKISDDFQKLMQNLDPHKICEIDTTLSCLAERDLKIQKQLETIKRYQQKLKEKVEICNLLNPTDQNAKIDKEQISKIFSELIVANPTFKKIQSIEGQLYEFRAYGDMISDINKKIGKIQKEFDLQSVIYSLKGLEEYIKKELLMMNTKVAMVESALSEQKKRRPISARKATDGKMTSSISYKKLVPVDCISCFQNPMGERSPEQKKLFGRNY